MASVFNSCGFGFGMDDALIDWDKVNVQCREKKHG
jgi:hypothetical protein